MSQQRSSRADEERLSTRGSVLSSRASPKQPPSESGLSRDSRQRSSPAASDRSNRPDQSHHSYSVRGMVKDSEDFSQDSRSRDGHRRDRRDHNDDDRRHRDRGSESDDSRSDDQYSSDYESEESMSGTGTYSRSYDSRSRSSPTATHTSASHDDRDDRGRYQGDISEWGRKRVNPRANNSESDYTLSSGLSPRGSEGDERAEFDPEEAKRALVYNAGLYGRAQTMRRDGTAPKTMGIADDLPNRFALEQLSQLAGMASKVQAAIEHNRKVFANRVRHEDRAVMKKAFDAWRAARFGSIAKQQLLRRAIARLQRGLMARAFFAWKDKFHLVDKYLAMRRKVSATINRGRVKRAFQEWRRLCTERWWKNQLNARDSQIHALNIKIEGFEKRPIVIIRQRRLRACLWGWWGLSIERRRKRMRRERAIKHWQNMAFIKAWNSWVSFVEEAKRRRAMIRKVGGRIKNYKLWLAWNAWWSHVERKRETKSKAFRAVRLWQKTTLAKGWNKWKWYVEYRREYKMIINRWKNPLKARALRTWVAWVDWKKRMRIILQRAAVRLAKRSLIMAWEAWWQAIDDRKIEEQLTTKEQLVVTVKELREENERLRRDNERFVRLIDSGEWGRGRVAELLSAGEILKGERDALLKLIQSLRREYEAVQHAKVAQDEEMKALKERMLLGGAARNRMLVKGGSSFNALVRAMKQDLVEGGPGAQAGARDPNLLYQVDKLSLDQVTVFPDGELNVQAVTSVPQSAAFTRPISAGRGLRNPPINPSAGPVQPMRMPAGFMPGAGASPSRGPAPPPGRPLAVGSASPGGRPVSREEVVARLQSLSKEELDSFEAALRAQKAAGGMRDPGRPGGLASSQPSYR
ncbi:hypothetical protein HYH03_002937 [Edaphochlamys debaryana]|uniref:Uncharacterized protein n=1 Tax=Edaphochlamys debaryana TaxID=47281 RepID=A0A836C540_9CHLO|nr:hypothetical protein HYH03_002937 [Edaphochlamys debaryana]|eukprot:KAG2499362.1 hypothetical protein HYH03_002937 [Edaphochlamys debaryana]